MTIHLSPAPAETFTAAGNTFTVLDDGAATGGRIGLVGCQISPGWIGPPQHVHAATDETWFVLAGAVRFTTGARHPAGQGPIDPDGELVGAGDFEAQARATFLNLRTVLDAAGAARGAVVKLTAYLTDMAHVRTYGRVRNEFVDGPPAGTVVQVGALAVPGMMLEVEATAVVGAATQD